VVGSDNERFIAQVYRDLLHREAEPTGLAFWVNELVTKSRTDVLMQYQNHVEPREIVVEELFKRLLNRTPDATGLQGFADALAFGRVTRQQIAATIISSPEYFEKHGGTADGFLDALFADGLHRQVDAAARAFFGNQDLNDVQVRHQVALEILAQPEFLDNLVNLPGSAPGNSSTTSLFQGWYQALLRRDADLEGQATFVKMLAAGKSVPRVLASIIASDEYFARL
jgi:hypothetical protein